MHRLDTKQIASRSGSPRVAGIVIAATLLCGSASQNPANAQVSGGPVNAGHYASGIAPTALRTPPLNLASLNIRAAAIAKSLATACPVVPYNDEAAFQACTQALKEVKLPLLPDIAWGGDQPDKQIKKRNLTHFDSQVFQTMYLPLYTFSGRYSVEEDKGSHSPVIRLEAYFRNTLPTGDYPYPFWHSADKWSAYETSNEIRMYFNPKGQAFIVTRDAAGSEEQRGPYVKAVTPAFDGNWQWKDANGVAQPHVSLFSSRFSAANPNLPALDQSYRAFALRIRDSSCLNCHTPSNKAQAERLTLLQTPRHAAAEINNVIHEIKNGEMPQDDVGLRKDIPAEERAAVLAAAIAFRNKLTAADRWEAANAAK